MEILILIAVLELFYLTVLQKNASNVLKFIQVLKLFYLTALQKMGVDSKVIEKSELQT